MRDTSKASSRMQRLLSLLVAVALVFGTFALAGCRGGGEDEQDNCYGEDMPVVNEDSD